MDLSAAVQSAVAAGKQPVEMLYKFIICVYIFMSTCVHVHVQVHVYVHEHESTSVLLPCIIILCHG